MPKTKQTKKVLIIILTLLAALAVAFYFISRPGKEEVLKDEISKTLTHKIPKVIGHDVKMSDIFVNLEENSFKLENISFAPQKSEKPLFGFKELSGEIPVITEKKVHFKTLKASGLELPRLLDQQDPVTQESESYEETFLKFFFELDPIEQRVRDLYPKKVEARIKELGLLYRELVPLKEEADKQEKIKAEIEELIDKTAFVDILKDIQESTLRGYLLEEITLGHLVMAILRPYVEPQLKSLISWLTQTHRAYTSSAKVGEDAKSLQLDKLEFVESNRPEYNTSLVGSIQQLNSQQQGKPLSVRAQGNYEKYHIKGLDFSVNIHEGKQTGIVIKNNILSYKLKNLGLYQLPEIELQIKEADIKLESHSFVIGSQTSGSYQVEIKGFDFSYEGKSGLIGKIIEELNRLETLSLKISFTHFAGEGFTSFEIEKEEDQGFNQAVTSYEDLLFDELNHFMNVEVQKDQDTLERYREYLDFYLDRLEKYESSSD